MNSDFCPNVAKVEWFKLIGLLSSCYLDSWPNIDIMDSKVTEILLAL